VGEVVDVTGQSGQCGTPRGAGEVAFAHDPAPPADRVIKSWDDADDDYLREHYRKRGARHCAAHLKRTEDQIYWRASRLGVARQAKDYHYRSSPQIDEAIRRAYQGDRKPGFRKALVQALGRPERWISHRAVKLGVASGKCDRWSAEEDAILKQAAHLHPRTLAGRLQKHGFRRTPTAVALRLARLRLNPDEVESGYLTLQGVADLLGAQRATVQRWLRNGWLVVQPGKGRMNGHLIYEGDVAAFIALHLGEVNFARLEQNKQYIVEMLLRHCSWRDTRHAPISRRAISVAAVCPELSTEEIAERIGADVRTVQSVLSRRNAEAA
jgi:hypothetical protein